jgi:hypothetical protein
MSNRPFDDECGLRQDPETSEMNWGAFDLGELPFASPTTPIKML